jgi:hypothetical protein
MISGKIASCAPFLSAEQGDLIGRNFAQSPKKSPKKLPQKLFSLGSVLEIKEVALMFGLLFSKVPVMY